MYPKKTEKIDYNRFSPYTPVPYYVDETTKWQNYHIDVLGYINENQLNTKTYYYKDYNDSFTEDDKKVDTLDWHDPYAKLAEIRGEKKHNHHH